jgi:hypothetical protein
MERLALVALVVQVLPRQSQEHLYLEQVVEVEVHLN